jgi:hypothetical protein
MRARTLAAHVCAAYTRRPYCGPVCQMAAGRSPLEVRVTLLVRRGDWYTVRTTEIRSISLSVEVLSAHANNNRRKRRFYKLMISLQLIMIEEYV